MLLLQPADGPYEAQVHDGDHEVLSGAVEPEGEVKKPSLQASRHSEAEGYIVERENPFHEHNEAERSWQDCTC